MAGTDYQRASAHLLGIANQLRALGVDSNLKVPTLVIAGDQSSGKSSVVEAIAGVPLPRAEGTCTRCPTEVRMRTHADPAKGGSSGAAPWRCHIKLFRSHDSDSKPLPPSGKPREELLCTVTDKAHISACVTAAQAVLLNPKKVAEGGGGIKLFVPLLGNAQAGGGAPEQSSAVKALGAASEYELQFTANKVVLEIDGAEADLTIIDLPGIIHSHSRPELITMVHDLVKSYLAPPNHIIAMTLQAGLDAETQAIRLWAREVDPEGHRSIGIITKPDRVGEEEDMGWRKLLNLMAGAGGGTRAGATTAAVAPGGSDHLQLGYYVELTKRLMGIADTLQAHAQADVRGAGSLDFYQGLQRHYEAYGEGTIRATPAFLVGTTLISCSALSSSDKGMDSDAGGPVAAAGEMELKDLVADMEDGPEIESAIDAMVAMDDELVQLELSDLKFPERYMTLDEVEGLRKRHLGRELPGFLPYSAMEELLSRFKGQWREQSLACLAAVEQAAHKLAEEVVAQHLDRYPQAKSAVESALYSHVECLVQETVQELEQLLAREDGDVFTLNTSYYRDMQAAFLGRLKRAHLQPKQPGGEAVQRVRTALTELAGHGANFPTFDDAFTAQRTRVDNELLMAASCLAYFKVAFKRMQDAVPMAVRATLLQRLGSRAALEAAVWRELLGGEANALAAAEGDHGRDSRAAKAAVAAALLQEDPHLAARRRHCQALEQKLTAALKLLNTPIAKLH
ncbi:hypothetical protein HXX76_011002 [Chlamydomonas incerta]|uniref:GED domain-containing protein n=1 Tax=Chlamydomonas incerta TaxID=51695 RepID=A0A835SL79_CHLIN|nr:hypothetical protein HXX76_011002 [Chlamydomonas incerta]|eukprot:KAG2429232.1 hypothetical protein HXX76_011002 [Chlamydomonas incerta]